MTKQTHGNDGDNGDDAAAVVALSAEGQMTGANVSSVLIKT